jgi:nitrous oxidase accessory protein NosD
MRRIYSAAATTLLAIAIPGSAAAQALTLTVDCANGGTIAHALAQGDSRKPLVVVVRGTCNEHVAISRDDVTLRGAPGVGGAVNGPDSTAPAILVRAQRTGIESLTVTGGANGIVVSGPFSASLTKVVVSNPASGNAVIVRSGADLSVTGCTLMQASRGLLVQRGGSVRVLGNTEIRDNSDTGIYADQNSIVNVSGGSKILSNGGHGIDLENGSQGSISDSEIADNSTGVLVSASQASIGANNLIHNNRENGVLAQVAAAVDVSNNSISYNGENGVFGYLGSTLVMHGNDIAFNGTGVACRADCTLQMGGASIRYNTTHAVVVMLDSRAIFQSPVTTATPNGEGWVDLWCGDAKSTVDGVDGLSYDGGDFFDGSVSPTCVGFSD